MNRNRIKSDQLDEDLARRSETPRNHLIRIESNKID